MKWTIDGSLALQNLDIIDGANRICMIDCENEALSDSDIMANARLIAAAPDLLEALWQIVTDAEIDCDTEEAALAALADIRVTARNAIAKAKGA